jgi:hypothetical protein
MNDLTFGVTLLSFLATLATAVIVQTTAAPARTAEVSAGASSTSSRIGPAQVAHKDCTSVALAPADVR